MNNYILIQRLIHRAVAYEYSLLYVRSLEPSSEAAQAAALTLIATALRLPTIFDFDPLFKLDAVLNVKNHELFSLLQIFLNNDLAEFKEWQSKYTQTLEKYGKRYYLLHIQVHDEHLCSNPSGRT